MKGTKSCAKCKFYDNAPTMGYGYCHRYPCSNNDRLKVDDLYWCGEYKVKGGKQ